jgi:hypothetical protein
MNPFKNIQIPIPSPPPTSTPSDPFATVTAEFYSKEPRGLKVRFGPKSSTGGMQSARGKELRERRVKREVGTPGKVTLAEALRLGNGKVEEVRKVALKKSLERVEKERNKRLLNKPEEFQKFTPSGDCPEMKVEVKWQTWKVGIRPEDSVPIYGVVGR